MAGKYRYTVALPRGSGRVFLAWRLLADDAPGAPFHVERLGPGGAWQRLTEDPVIDSTTFVDTTPVPGEHQYRIVDAGGAASEAVRVDSSAPSTLVALDVPLDPDHRHTGLILGDLENNARMGFVLRSLRGHTLWLSAVGLQPRGRAAMGKGHVPARRGLAGARRPVPLLGHQLRRAERGGIPSRQRVVGRRAPRGDRAGRDHRRRGRADGSGRLGAPLAWDARARHDDRRAPPRTGRAGLCRGAG